MKKLGLITIGQSPRDDVTKELIPLLDSNVEILEYGVLDGYNEDVIATMFGPRDGEIVYVTRLRNGKEVIVSRNKILRNMIQLLKRIAKKSPDIIVILCSGEFPTYKIGIPIIYPDKLLKGISSSLKIDKKTAVIIPSKEQIEYAVARWKKYFKNLAIYPISPYTSDEKIFIQLSKEFKKKDIRLALMDCIGYTLKQKEILEKNSPQTMIINTRSILSRFISELI